MTFDKRMAAKKEIEIFFEPKRKVLLSPDIGKNGLTNQVKNQFLRLMSSLSKDMNAFAIKTEDKEKTKQECETRFEELKKKFLKTFKIKPNTSLDSLENLPLLPYKKAIELIQKL